MKNGTSIDDKNSLLDIKYNAAIVSNGFNDKA
jgi:hypothetical protein